MLAAFATVALALPVGAAVENAAIQKALATAAVVAWFVVAYAYLRLALEKGYLAWPNPRLSQEPIMFWAGMATRLLIWLTLMVVLCAWAWGAWFIR